METAPSLLALASTAHIVLAMLRVHRGQRRAVSLLLAAPSFVLAATPWAFPAASAVAAGLGLNALWFAAGERLAPARPPARARRPERAVTLRVLDVRQETDEIRTFRLERPPDFEFRPGQYVTVLVPVDGRLVSRCYSVCSSPSTHEYFEISVRRQGLVSAALHVRVRPGGTLAIRRPAGTFVYPEADPRPLVLVGGGIGITPLLAMLRHAAEADAGRSVSLLLSVRTARDIPFREELAELARRRPGIRVVVTATRGGTAGGGRIDADFLRREVPDPRGSVFCMCGPTPMVEDIRAALSSLGVPDAQVRAEAFEAARHAPPAAPGTAHELELTVSGKTVKIAPGQSLLEAAEAAGADIPFSCRSGVCQSCRTLLVRGDVDCRADGLSEADRRAGFVFPCVSRARSDCALEA